MKTAGAHHVSFAVRDLDASRRFFGELLELEEIERPDFGFPGAWYQAGAVQIHLIAAPPNLDLGSPPPKLSPLAAHLAFEVADYAQTRDALAAAGLEVMETNADVGQMWVQDPDGHVIELIVPGGQLGRR